MRILLIQPSDIASGTLSPLYQKHGALKILKDRHQDNRTIALPPLGLLYVATPALNAGHEVKVLDAYTLQLSNGEIVEEARRFQPDLIGLSLYSVFLRTVHALTEQLKKSVDAPIVAGGGHASALPEQTLAEFGSVDSLVRGWGDFALMELAQHAAGTRRREEVRGLCWRDGGGIRKNPLADLPADLDDIPIPNRSPLWEMYRNHLYFNILSPRRNMDALMTSRNCPFSCRFCGTGRRDRFAYHSHERVMTEIHDMLSRGIDAIEVMDDTFMVRKDRAARVLDKLADDKVDVELRVRSRVDQIDEDMLRRLKRARTRAINYGMESGSDDVLGVMGKKTTVAQNEKACRMTKKAGILCQTSWMFGMPGETARMRAESIGFVRRILPHTATFNVLIPLPGTPVYEQAKKDGSLVGDWSVRCDQVFVRTDEVQDYAAFDAMISGEQRRFLTSIPFLWQLLGYWLRHPNLRLFRFGLRVMLGKVQRRALRSRLLNDDARGAEEV